MPQGWLKLTQAVNNVSLSIGKLSLDGSLSYTSQLILESDNEGYFKDFTFSIDGTVTTSNGLSLVAKANLEADFEDKNTYSSNIDAVDSLMNLTLDLTDKTTDNQKFTADLKLKFVLDDGINISSYNDIYISKSATLDLSSSIEIHVGEKQVGLSLSVDDNYSSINLFDLTNSEHDIRFTYLQKANVDFDSGAVIVGQITVDGEKQADVLLDINNQKVIADFDSLEDVVLTYPDQLVL
jgi:hypothetical protein